MSLQILNELLQPLVEDLGYEFVGIEYSNNPKNSVLRLYIDSENGVDIKDCETVSRETAALLDVKDPIKSQYNLEVSSPGLARPLFTLAHYSEFVGEQAKITLFAPQDGRRKFVGPILGVDESTIRIEQDGVEASIDFDNVVKAKLVPDYEKILANHKPN